VEHRPGALEELGMTAAFWQGRRVFLTGHTGFKGAWLALWLRQLGAEVTGYSLAPPTQPSLFALSGMAGRMASIEADIRDAARLRAAVVDLQPEVVFHLAAQALVRRSYADPAETFSSNVMGTVHLLDAVRACDTVRGVVVVTSDKCYENRGLDRGYVEDDPLGGYDPYSSSKACTELVAAAYRQSFLSDGVAVATARAGNVIGGGDWAEDRILPDCIRALRRGRPIRVRNPRATRPWQHVLEPLGGYLTLAARLLRFGNLSGAYNFGPSAGGNRTVAEVVKEVLACWPGRWKKTAERAAPHEAGLLQLDNRLARRELGWRPGWSFQKTIRETVRWYWAEHRREATPRELTEAQIADYMSHLSTRDSSP